MTRYTAEVGRKFYADGRIRPFRGYSILTLLSPGSVALREAENAARILRELPCSVKYAWLPPASYHMTVMDLVCDEVRQAEAWPANVGMDAPIDKVGAELAKRMTGLHPPTEIRVVYKHLQVANGYVLLHVDPADDLADRELRQYRDRVAAATGLWAPNHEDYGFHITLAYLLAELDPPEQEQVEAAGQDADDRLSAHWGVATLPEPGLHCFEDMATFVPVPSDP